MVVKAGLWSVFDNKNDQLIRKVVLKCEKLVIGVFGGLVNWIGYFFDKNN